jgi:hypothetical protein
MCAATRCALALGLLLLTANGARADMTSAASSDAQAVALGPAGPQAERERISATDPLVGLDPVDLSTCIPFAPLPDTGANAADPGTAQEALRLLPDDRSSLDMCLYALMGLGLCRSASWVKRLSLGSIPEWYHSGDPGQLGPSCAVGPNCLCPMAACFIQPNAEAEDRLARLLRQTTAFSRSQAQSPCDPFPPRGPPPRSCHKPSVRLTRF